MGDYLNLPSQSFFMKLLQKQGRPYNSISYSLLHSRFNSITFYKSVIECFHLNVASRFDFFFLNNIYS